jgi:transcriptional regulator with XRE-family HTH domain
MTQLLNRWLSPAVENARPAPTEVNGSREEIGQGGEIFGRLVAVRRAGLGLSQEDLATRMDTSQSNVAGIEEGRPPSLDTLTRLATALDVEPGTAAVLSSLGGRRLWGSLGIAVPICVLAIVGLRISGTDGGDSFGRLPEAASAAPAPPVVGMETAGTRQDRGEPGDEEAPGDSRSNSRDSRSSSGDKRSSTGAPRQSASQPAGQGGITPARTPRPKPPPAPSVSPPQQAAPAPPVSPLDPSGQGSPSVAPKPTGKPVGTPGNGPGGTTKPTGQSR